MPEVNFNLHQEGADHLSEATFSACSYEVVFKSRHRPKIVTLCGSTRFPHAYEIATLQWTVRGYIVLSAGATVKKDAYLDAVVGSISPEQKVMLDELHLRKIDMSDEIVVLNVDGYVGDSVREEIVYALEERKGINWIEPFVIDSFGKKIATHEYLVQLATQEQVGDA
jgi:hypothetical protein